MADLEGLPSKDDLPRIDFSVPNGTRYLGETAGVAVRERCGRFLAGHQPVPQTHLQGRVVTMVRLPAATGPVADATSTDAALFGEAGARDWPVVGTVSLAHALASLGYDLTRSRIPSAAAAAPDDEAEPEDA